MEAIPKFDPNQPFEEYNFDSITADIPKFDPNKEYTMSDSGEVVSPAEQTPEIKDKISLIDEEYNLQKEKMIKAKEYISNLTEIDDETKKILMLNFDINQNKAEQSIAEKRDKALKELEIQNMNNDYTPKTITEQAISGAKQVGEDIADMTEGTIRGGGRMILGLGKVGQDITNNLTGTEIQAFDNWIKKNEQAIKDKGLEGSALVGEVLSNILPVARLRNLAYITGAEFLVGGATGLGETGSYTEAGIRATEQGATALAGGFVISKTLQAIDSISLEAKLLGKKIGLSDEEIITMTQGVSRDQQVRKVAEAGGEDVIGNYQRAVDDSDRLKIKLSGQIDDRTKQIDDLALKGEFNEASKAATDSWKTMEKVIGNSGIKIDSSDLTSSIDRVVNFAGGDQTALNNIIALQKKLVDNPNLGLDELLNIRKQTNDMMTKTYGKQGFQYYDELKKLVDKKIKNNTPNEYQDYINKTISNYEKVKTNEKLLDIIDKSSTSELVSGHSKRALDYNKAMKIIEEENLKGTVVEQTMNQLKKFDDKFNTDYTIMGFTKTKGENPETGMLAFMSKIKSVLMKNFWRFGESGENIIIQNGIEKALNKSNSPTEFIQNVVKEKNIPYQIKQDMVEGAKSIGGLKRAERNRIKAAKEALKKFENDPKMIEYKPIDFTTGSSKATSKGFVPEELNKAQQMERALKSRQRGANIYNPKGEFSDIQAPQRREAFTEIVDELKPSSRQEYDIIDTEVIPKGGKNIKSKRFTYKQIELADELGKKIEDIDTEIKQLQYQIDNVGKTNRTKAQKNKVRVMNTYKIKKLKASKVSLEKKIPKGL